jgi:hypothetical protein
VAISDFEDALPEHLRSTLEATFSATRSSTRTEVHRPIATGSAPRSLGLVGTDEGDPLPLIRVHDRFAPKLVSVPARRIVEQALPLQTLVEQAGSSPGRAQIPATGRDHGATVR